MVCCCDPFEPLSPEEMEESAEMIKSMQAEKSTQAAKTTSPVAATADQADAVDAATVEMEELLVSVVLPPGVYPGQKIEVRSPDGSRTVDTVIPVGLHPGQAFLVKFPPVPKSTLKLQGSLASIREYTQGGIQEREEAESERGGEERDEVDQSPSFVQVLDDFLTPKPDPDVIEAMEKAKKEAAAESFARKLKTAPTPEAGGKAVRDKIGIPDAPTRNDRNAQEELRHCNSDGERSHGSKSIKSVVSSHIKKVQGEAVEASVTRVAAEPIKDIEGEGPDDKKSKESQELYSSSSFVKSLEDFFTPKPDVPPSKVPENVDSETRKDAPASQHAVVPMQTSPNQKLVLVHVPPELLPGTTIYVEIPGESRTVAAQVPPGVTSFHVAYTPQQPLAHVPAPPMMASADMVLRQPQVGREKLLSVRVPPGTLPGTTLHISVPDEPGRILAAQVPPGNVKKFHVSYVPREQARLSGSGMLPPASPYQQAVHPTTGYHER